MHNPRLVSFARGFVAAPWRLPVIAVLAMAAMLWRLQSRPPYLPLPEVAPLVRPNARTDIAAAARLLVHRGHIYRAWSGTGRPGVDVARLVRRNDAAVQRLRRGFGRPYAQPGECSLLYRAEAYRDTHDLVRLLAVRARLAARQGDVDESLLYGLDALELGAMVGYGAPGLPWFYGMGDQEVARRALWSLVPSLSARQARAAVGRMGRIQRLQRPLWRSLRQAERVVVQGLDEEFRTHRTGRQFIDVLDLLAQGDLSEAALRIPGTRHALRQAQAVLRTRAEWAKARYALRGPPPKEPLFLLPVQITTADLLGDARYNALEAAVCQAENALLQVSFAIQAFQRDRGSYPDRLDRLTDGYLSGLPADPFAVGGTFGYRRTAGHYRLWSVGPDGIDNRGRAIVASWMHECRAKHHVCLDSSGDVVAGVNLAWGSHYDRL